jgi:hypothetical protein
MLAGVLDPRCRKERQIQEKSQGKEQPSSTCPRILTSLFSQLNCRVILLEPVSLATTIPRISLPSVSQLRYFVNGAYCLGYWYQDPGGNGSRYPVYACPKKGSLPSSDMEGMNQFASTILMSWMFSTNLLRFSSVQTRTGGRKP